MKKFFILFVTVFFVQYAFSQAKTPLDEAHSRLEKDLDEKTLQEIDSLESKDDMILYHHSIGMYIRNNYGLWSADSELCRYLLELGFRHPDDMSSAILESFWCKRHGVEYDLDAEIKKYAEYWDKALAWENEEKERYRKAQDFIKNNMVEITFSANNAPTLSLPSRTMETECRLRIRYLCKNNKGVYASVRKLLENKNQRETYGSIPYQIDLTSNTIKAIECPQLDEIISSVQINDVLWIYGKKGKTGKLDSIQKGKTKTLSLPDDEGNPTLGIFSDDLIAVYSHKIYRLSGSAKWTEIFSSTKDIPNSSLPPAVYDDLLYIRDEGFGENRKSLWLIDLKSSKMEKFYEKTGLVGTYGPRWENNFSYSLDPKGNLYVTAGEGSSPKSLIRQSKTGSFEFLVYEDKINGKNIPKLDISAVNATDTYVLLAGQSGLFKLTGNTLTPIVYFKNTRQLIPQKNDSNYHWGWYPSDIIELSTDDYLISGTFGGTYRIKKTNGQWEIIRIE